MSIKTQHGVISQVSEYSYVWNVPNLFNITEEFRHVFSPKFRVRDKSWWIKLSKDGGAVFLCLIRNLVDGDVNPCTVTYRLYIPDILGEDYWTTTLLTGTFSFAGKIGQIQTLSEYNLRRDESRIISEGILPLHLTFSSHEEYLQHPEQGTPSDESRSSTSDVASQTCSDLKPEESCACSADGIYELTQNFKDLLLSGQKSDVNFNVKGRHFKAHKLILMSRSPVFDKMFDNDMVEQKSGSVDVTDCDPDMFYIFLLYLYCGKVEILTINNAVDLYYIADKYNVEGLTQCCIKFMLNNLTVESFGEIISLSLLHSELELLSATYSFFAANMKQIISTEYWKNFNRDKPDEANELLIKALSQDK